MKNILDDLTRIKELDKSNMLGLLEDFPGQLGKASAVVRDVRLDGYDEISNIVFSGLGGSAIGGDVVRCCLADELNVPFVVNRDYRIPSFVSPKTLFFASSYSGNTEETISAYKNARKKKANTLVITSGGILEGMARSEKSPCIKIPGGLPPRCALGYSFFPMLVLLRKLGIIKGKSEDIDSAIKRMRELEKRAIGVSVLSSSNTREMITSLFGAD